MEKIGLVKKLLENLNDVECLIDDAEGINFISNDYDNSFNAYKIEIITRVCNCLDINLVDVID